MKTIDELIDALPPHCKAIARQRILALVASLQKGEADLSKVTQLRDVKMTRRNGRRI